MSDNNRIFISCASREFQHPGAPFAGLREHLARQLVRADCEVKWQEVFRQPGDDTDTVRKVGDYVRDCAAVIHLIGAEPGDRANPKAVADFLQAEPAFLGKYPELRAALGDFSDLTYTQWEAFQALHYGVGLFLYVTPAGAAAQREHLSRLRLARRYPGEPFATVRDRARPLRPTPGRPAHHHPDPRPRPPPRHLPHRLPPPGRALPGSRRGSGLAGPDLGRRHQGAGHRRLGRGRQDGAADPVVADPLHRPRLAGPGRRAADGCLFRLELLRPGHRHSRRGHGRRRPARRPRRQPRRLL